jgi:hypothetical protein
MFLIIFSVSYTVSIILGACGETSGGTGTAVTTRNVLFNIPFGFCQIEARMNLNSCCIFDFSNPNSAGNIGNVVELIANYTGSCGFNRIVPFPGGANCWHGSISVTSSNYSKSYDLSSPVALSNSELFLDDPYLRVKIPNETATVDITVFEPCLPFTCRRRPQDFPRVIWRSRVIVDASQVGTVTALVTESITASSAGLCN